MSNFKPPFTTTSKIIHYISDIAETLGKISVLYTKDNSQQGKELAIQKRIQSALAAENIHLTQSQISAIYHNDNIDLPKQLIEKVIVFIKFYNHLVDWNKDQSNDLLNLHKELTPKNECLAGSYRLNNIANGKKLQMAPQALHIPKMIDELLNWFVSSTEHPLIKSSVFHYELKFIHPFVDRNTLIGCIWQTKTLQQWNPLFTLLPIESIVANTKDQYCEAINSSTKTGDSSVFIEYVLKNILDASKDLTLQLQAEAPEPQALPKKENAAETLQVKALINVLEEAGEALNRKQLQARLALKDRKHFRERYLKPAMDAALIEMTIPDKPNSKLQKYRLIS
ncbi:Fic family protein [Pseudoalteromonas distincta]|uniref:Fic family protein n=1 Tax=Pseudoalteromonas distincta TaxID=77608 RepID=UPI0032E0637F